MPTCAIVGGMLSYYNVTSNFVVRLMTQQMTSDE